MKKVISTRDFSAIKKMAQIVNPLVTKKANILKKVNALMEEVEGPTGLNVQINGMEAGIKAKFLGLGTEQLVRKVVTPAVREDGTPVLDAKTGKQLTKTTWEPMPCLKYDAEKNNYILTVEDEEGQSEKYEELPENVGYPQDFEGVPAVLSSDTEENTENVNDNLDDPFNF